MARPEDTLARGAGLNGGFEPGYDDGLEGQRRADPRAPMRGPNQTGIPLAPDPQREQPRGAQPGVTPRFDPYLPQGNAAPPRQQAPDQSRTYADPRQNGRQDPRLEFPPQGQQAYAQDPFQQRAPQGAAPNGQRAPQGAQQPMPPVAPPVGAPRYAAPAPGERGAPVRPSTQGRPGQTARPSANGHAPPAAQHQDIVPPVRGRDPYLDTGAKRLPPVGPNGSQTGTRPAYGYAQDGYGEDKFPDSAEADDEDFEASEDDEDYADEAPRKSRRGLYVMAALAVAIVLGGGLGYAYKLSMGSGTKDGAPRVLQADKAPAKTVPADAGGQAFDTSKKTILDRAGETPDGTATKVVTSSEQVAATTDGSSGNQADALAGPRKVNTVVVKPGQPIAADATPAAMDDGVPGISLGDLDPAPQAKPAKVPDAAALKAKMKAATKTAGTTAQQVADTMDQTATAAGDAAADAQAVAAEAAQQPTKLAGASKAAAAAKKVVKVAAADPVADPAAGSEAMADPAAAVPAAPAKKKVASAADAATAPAKVGSGGYILQVFSGKSQAESLAYFADMQQKFGDLLGSGQPDIQEVDLGTQGKKFRLRIGPPGSGTSVKSLCTKLKASGLKDCIVAAY